MASGKSNTRIYATYATVSGGEGDARVYFSWTSKANIAKNTSTLTFSVYQKWDDNGSTRIEPIAAVSGAGNPEMHFTINDDITFSLTTYPTVGEYTDTWAKMGFIGPGQSTPKTEFSIEVPHNEDGTCNVNIAASWEIAGKLQYNDMQEGNVSSYTPHTIELEVNLTSSGTLDTIPAPAALITASNFTDEENPVITYNNPAGNNVGALEACISLTGGEDDIAYRAVPKTGTSYTFVLTEDEKNVLRLAAVNSQSIQVRFYLRATTDGVQFHSYLTRNFTVVNCSPIINNPTIQDVNSTSAELTGDPNVLVRHYSMVEFGFEPVGSKYATIVNQYVQCGSKKVSGMNYGIIDDIESGTFIFGATDSRGVTSERVVEKPIVEYVKPTCYQDFDTELVGETGANITLKISGNYFNGTFGAVKNTLKVEARFTDNDGVMSEWTELLVSPTFNGNTYQVELTFTGLDYSKSYTFQSRVSDKLYTVQSTQYTVRLLPIFDWSENDFNFNVPVNVNGDTVLSHNRDAKNTILSASNHVYVRPGGPSDTSSQTIFYSNGNVEFSGEVIANGEVLGGAADFVVETGTASMGTNGTWYWTKWNSGKAECYGKRNFGNMAITTAWGGLYRSEALTQTLPSGLFTAIPEVISIDLINSNYGGWIVRHESTAPTASNTGSFIVVRPASATITPSNIGFNVIGRWK